VPASFLLILLKEAILQYVYMPLEGECHVLNRHAHGSSRATLVSVETLVVFSGIPKGTTGVAVGFDEAASGFGVGIQSELPEWHTTRALDKPLTKLTMPLYVFSVMRGSVELSRGGVNMRRMRGEDTHGARDRDRNAIAIV
jgi:hypothetical protein